jgi:pyruvate kinase
VVIAAQFWRADLRTHTWPATHSECALMCDVRPFALAYEGHDREKLLFEAEQALLENKVVERGYVVITMGEPIGESGGTNTMKIVRIGEHRPT